MLNHGGDVGKVRAVVPGALALGAIGYRAEKG
jgi:hypothetical protein